MADREPPDRHPALRVVRAGILDLLVDSGRRGWQRFGMPPGGPADEESFHLAGVLAGAGAGAPGAAIEVTAAGPELEAVGGACRLAVASAGDVALTMVRRDGVRTAVAQFTTLTLHEGERLRVGRVTGVLRAYVAVAGGIDVPPQLGSRSACLRGATSGLLARPLRAGDVLRLDAGACAPGGPELTLTPPAVPLGGDPIRVAPGPQEHLLDAGAAEALAHGLATFHVGAASDRAGIRLAGPALGLSAAAEVPSQGCPPGAVQVTGDGTAILLGPDRGTTGGYAVPAVVAAVDVPRLGRLRPGAPVRFRRVDVDAAEALRAERATVVRRAAGSLRGVA